MVGNLLETMLYPGKRLTGGIISSADNKGTVLQSMADDVRENIRFELQMMAQPVLLPWTQLNRMKDQSTFVT